MPSPFLVNVGGLRKAAGTRSRQRRAGPLAGLAVTASAVPEGGEVVVEVVLESVPGAVLATGTVAAPWEGACRRCAGTLSGRLAVAVRELFEERPDPDQTYPLDGDRLDLAPMARDAVLLELPLAPLCRPACQGLCPTCGVDRNEGACTCPPRRDERWGALDALAHELKDN